MALLDKHSETERETTAPVSARTAAKFSALMFVSFLWWLFVFSWHVLSYGWNVSGDALFAALTTFSAAGFLRPMAVLTFLQRLGGPG